MPRETYSQNLSMAMAKNRNKMFGRSYYYAAYAWPDAITTYSAKYGSCLTAIFTLTGHKPAKE